MLIPSDITTYSKLCGLALLLIIIIKTLCSSLSMTDFTVKFSFTFYIILVLNTVFIPEIWLNLFFSLKLYSICLNFVTCLHGDFRPSKILYNKQRLTKFYTTLHKIKLNYINSNKVMIILMQN